jgi:hypothetical protein
MTYGRVALLLALHVAMVTAILFGAIAAGRAASLQYRAVTLLCPADRPLNDCDRSSALDILATVPVPTPFACMMSGMSAAAHMHQLASAGTVKILCEAR